jgi:hypothetical protein
LAEICGNTPGDVQDQNLVPAIGGRDAIDKVATPL